LPGGLSSLRGSAALTGGTPRRAPPPGAFRWEKAGLGLRAYDSLMLDPVEVRVAPGSAAATLGPETLRQCARRFDEVLVETIAPHRRVVAQPGAHTLRVRVALT